MSAVKYTLLALLYDHPLHGYKLGKLLPLTLRTDFEVKASQIASTLNRLEAAGLVAHQINEAEAAPHRKVYQLTEKGIQELKAWYITPEERRYQLGDTFYHKFVFSLISAPVSPEQVLINQRRHLYQELHDVIDLRNKADEQNELPLILLLETVIGHLEADIRWIDMCEARLPELQQFRPPKPKPKPRGRPRKETLKED